MSMMKKADFPAKRFYVNGERLTGLLLKTTPLTFGGKIIDLCLLRHEPNPSEGNGVHINYYCLSPEDFITHCNAKGTRSAISEKDFQLLNRSDSDTLIAVAYYDPITKQRAMEVNIVTG